MLCFQLRSLSIGSVLLFWGLVFETCNLVYCATLQLHLWSYVGYCGSSSAVYYSCIILAVRLQFHCCIPSGGERGKGEDILAAYFARTVVEWPRTGRWARLRVVWPHISRILWWSLISGIRFCQIQFRK